MFVCYSNIQHFPLFVKYIIPLRKVKVSPKSIVSSHFGGPGAGQPAFHLRKFVGPQEETYLPEVVLARRPRKWFDGARGATRSYPAKSIT